MLDAQINSMKRALDEENRSEADRVGLREIAGGTLQESGHVPAGHHRQTARLFSEETQRAVQVRQLLERLTVGDPFSEGRVGSLRRRWSDRIEGHSIGVRLADQAMKPGRRLELGNGLRKATQAEVAEVLLCALADET